MRVGEGWRISKLGCVGLGRDSFGLDVLCFRNWRIRSEGRHATPGFFWGLGMGLVNLDL